MSSQDADHEITKLKLVECYMLRNINSMQPTLKKGCCHYYDGSMFSMSAQYRERVMSAKLCGHQEKLQKLFNANKLAALSRSSTRELHWETATISMLCMLCIDIQMYMYIYNV